MVIEFYDELVGVSIQKIIHQFAGVNRVSKLSNDFVDNGGFFPRSWHQRELKAMPTQLHAIERCFVPWVDAYASGTRNLISRFGPNSTKCNIVNTLCQSL
jgi:hypothetical protein